MTASESLAAAASRLAGAMRPQRGRGVSISYGSVKAVSGGSLTATVGGADVTVPCTKECAQASAGERVVIATYGASSVAMGIIES